VIIPSKDEPFGLVALEALAAGKLLLSSFVDGMGEFLTYDTAVNCGVTPDTISQAVSFALNMPDDEKSSRIKKGLQICEKYTWESTANKIETVFNSLLNI